MPGLANLAQGTVCKILDQEEVIASTVRFYLERLNERFNQEHREQRVHLEVHLEPVTQYVVEEYGAAIRDFGGRAVQNSLDDALLPLLAQQLLDLEDHQWEGATTLVADVTTERGRKGLTVYRP